MPRDGRRGVGVDILPHPQGGDLLSSAFFVANLLLGSKLKVFVRLNRDSITVVLRKSRM